MQLHRNFHNEKALGGRNLLEKSMKSHYRRILSTKPSINNKNKRYKDHQKEKKDPTTFPYENLFDEFNEKLFIQYLDKKDS